MTNRWLGNLFFTAGLGLFLGQLAQSGVIHFWPGLAVGLLIVMAVVTWEDGR